MGRFAPLFFRPKEGYLVRQEAGGRMERGRVTLGIPRPGARAHHKQGKLRKECSDLNRVQRAGLSGEAFRKNRMRGNIPVTVKNRIGR